MADTRVQAWIPDGMPNGRPLDAGTRQARGEGRHSSHHAEYCQRLDLLLPQSLLDQHVGFCPCLFLANLPLLCLWPRLAIEIVYICPAIHQRFFELGLLLACTIFALSVVSRALEVSAVFMSPFFIFLALGSGSLAGARRNQIYTSGLERRRSIFCAREIIRWHP